MAGHEAPLGWPRTKASVDAPRSRLAVAAPAAGLYNRWAHGAQPRTSRGVVRSALDASLLSASAPPIVRPMVEKPRNYLSQRERRQQLLDLGLELFSAQSYDEVSTDDIARRAGVSKGLMYHYFGNKRGFYTAVVRFLARQILEFVAPTESRSRLENLRHGLEAYLDFVDKRGSAYLALINGGIGYDETIFEIIESTRGAIVDQIIEVIGVQPRGGWYRTATRSWLGAVEAAAQDWLNHEDTEREVVVSMLIVSLYAHLRAASYVDPDRVPIFDDETAGFAMTILRPRDD